jgi:hypothetical protein
MASNNHHQNIHSELAMRNITKAHRDALMADLSHTQYVFDQRRPPPNRYPCRKSPSTPVCSPPAVLLQGEGCRPQQYTDVDGERHHAGLDLVDLLPVKGASNYFCPPSGTSGAAGRRGCNGSWGMSWSWFVRYGCIPAASASNHPMRDAIAVRTVWRRPNALRWP